MKPPYGIRENVEFDDLELYNQNEADDYANEFDDDVSYGDEN